MSSPVVTAIEACAVVGVLEPRYALSYSSLRALDLVAGVVDPQRAVVAGQPRTRLLDPLDVSMLRLWVRVVSDSCQPRWVAGAVLSHHRIELRQVFRRGRDCVLVIRGLRSEIVTREAAAVMAGEKYPLGDVPVGVVEAMRDIRTQQPKVWTGCRRSFAADVETASLSAMERSA